MASTISPSDASSAQNSIGRTPARVPSTLRRSLLVKFTSVRYESPLNQGSWIQWWCLFHSHNNTVSEKKLAGPWLGSRGYPRKVTLHRMVQFISVRYESALNQGSRIQWWCLFHSQNNTVSEKKSAGPKLGSQGYPTKVTFGKIDIECQQNRNNMKQNRTFLGYPWDPSEGPAEIFSDTVSF